MPIHISQATHFWIEAGAMSGYYRHQIEFPNHLAEFFNANDRRAGIVLIHLIGSHTNNLLPRPIMYRGDDYDQYSQDIWRLGLPTPAEGGPVYAGQVILFKRIVADGDPEHYDLTVDSPGSVAANKWRNDALASPNSMVDRTGRNSGRPFGFW